MAEAALSDRQQTFECGAVVVAAAAAGDLFGVGLGDGSVRLIGRDGTERAIAAHDGACLCLAADIDERGFLTGGDDGKLVRTDADGTTETFATLDGRWIEHVVTHAGSGYRVYAAGKEAFVIDRKRREEPRKLAHPSSIGGLAINDKGRRLAVAHYNGVSLWWLAAKDSQAQKLEWKGSNLEVIFSPDGDYVISALQENALHGWRLSDGQHMRMTGYTAKVRSMSFSRKAHVLATGGSERVICWPFTGGGPMGKAPLEFGGGVAGPGAGTPVTAVASHPKFDLIAAGFGNGAVILGKPAALRTIGVVSPRGTPITALCWDVRGDRLLAGTEGGQVIVTNFRGEGGSFSGAAG